jgi:23S rRNA (cytidine1920-2'-O)/16S rRNA (cytidine1409-2'-O)-methyltransferase
LSSSHHVQSRAKSQTRLDVALVERGLAQSREQAQALILAGVVRLDGETERRAARKIGPGHQISLDERPRYVSRGGLKLERALDEFHVSVDHRVCLDVGASTGGFVDCLLQHGAQRVYAVDVGYGQLDWRLRGDSRVVAMERTNIRHLESLPESIDLATIDVSFISLKLVLPVVERLLSPDGPAITLIKPQFEAGRADVGRGGVVRNREVHAAVLRGLAEWSPGRRRLVDVAVSPLRGPAGNVELLGLWLPSHAPIQDADIARIVDEAHRSDAQ